MPRTKRTFSPESKAKLTNWANLIREQQESSMNVTKFCEAHSISKSQFYYWRGRLADRFVEAQLLEIVPLSAPITDSCTTFKNCTTDTTISNLSSLTMVCNNFLMGSGTNVVNLS